MAIKATQLRQNIYKILDRILETGIPVEIERKGRKLKIIPEKPVSKWDRLEKHNVINCDPEELVHMDWSNEWNNDAHIS